MGAAGDALAISGGTPQHRRSYVLCDFGHDRGGPLANEVFACKMRTLPNGVSDIPERPCAKGVVLELRSAPPQV